MALKLRKLSIEEFRDIYYDNLVEDFPLIERKPFYFLRKMYEDGKYLCYVVEEEGKMKGYASFVWERADVVLLDYFAIVSTERGSGLGSKMIRLLKKELKDKLIIFECEQPEIAEDNEDKDIRERRISFYRKNGANISDVEVKIIGVPYHVMYLDGINRRNIHKELALIYRNMFPKFIFRKLVKVE